MGRCSSIGVRLRLSMIRTQIYNLVKTVFHDVSQKYGVSINSRFDFTVDVPKNKEHGDYSVDIAFKLAGIVGRSPMDIGKSCIDFINARRERVEGAYSYIMAITLAQPGFINFKVSDDAWRNVVGYIKANESDYGRTYVGEGQRVLLEYVSANPTGPLTIAHGRQACLGDVLARVMKMSGYEVFREYYLNDGGRQIKLLGLSTRARYLELMGVEITFPEDGYLGDYINDIAQKIIEEFGDKYKTSSEQESLGFFSEYAKNYLMGLIRIDLECIGVEFDQYFSEQTLYGEKVDGVLSFLLARGLSFEKDDALWFDTTRFGDDKDRVLKKANGDFTYLVPDMAYHRDKFERGYDRVINLLGPDHHGYIKRLKAAVSAFGYNPEQLEILIVQLTTLYKNGEPYRMSTRAGNFVSLRQLIDEAGTDATRFFFLMRKINSHLDFDIDLAKEKSQDNPVFYLQYAHARIVSLINYSGQKVDPDADLYALSEVEDIEMIKILHDFPYQIAQTALKLEPYRLVDYLNNVAAGFHKYYAHQRVVSDDAHVTKARLLLCDCVRIVLHNGLELLGVSQPDQM